MNHSKNFNIMELNSASYDGLFAELCSHLDRCSAAAGGCDRCWLAKDCRAAFDILATETNHYKLKADTLREFKARYNRLSKQLMLIS